MGLAVSSGGLGAGGDVRLGGLSLAATASLAESGCGDEMLNDGAVAGKLEGRSRGALGSGFGDDGLQQ